MKSICPYCRGEIELRNNAWICLACWKRWPIAKPLEMEK